MIAASELQEKTANLRYMNETIEKKKAELLSAQQKYDATMARFNELTDDRTTLEFKAKEVTIPQLIALARKYSQTRRN
jgi:hypothetical protein